MAIGPLRKNSKSCNNPQTPERGFCMKGSISYLKDRRQFVVNWYDEKAGRNRTITRYKGEFMYSRKIAEKCLSMIQSTYEDYLNGRGYFRIENYLGKGGTSVPEFYVEWMTEVIEPKKKPATIKGYWSYHRNWIKPFFEKNGVMLHEVTLHTLNKLLNSIKLTGKGKLNVMMALRACMDYAFRSEVIGYMPPFPKQEEYNIVEPEFDWLWEEDQMRVINAIPEPHRPVLLWLKYHYRRPGEGCALFKTDYDVFNNAFWIRRTISDRKLVDRTKTGKAHYTPCHSKFTKIARQLISENEWSPFLFVNPRSRKKEEGGHYTLESLNNIWKAACREVGIKIRLYHGTKHSSCTQFINEKGGSDTDLQVLTDHARLDSVKKYRIVGLDRKRELMEKEKVVSLDAYRTHTSPKTEEE